MTKRILDLIIVCLCLAVIGIVLVYPEEIMWRGPILISAGILTVLFLVLTVRDKGDRQEDTEQMERNQLEETGLITEIVLLNE